MHTLTVFILVTLSLIALSAISWLVLQFYLEKFKTKKAIKEKQKILNKKKRTSWIHNHTTYFWSDASRFVWISMFFIFFIILGIVIDHPASYLFSIIVAFSFLFFLWFAHTSYVQFPQKAKEALNTFQKAITSAIEKEISFNGDNIQTFTHKDKEFDTKPQIFSFPVNVTKINYPPLEKKKKPIVHTQKLEFLILSREYLSICKESATFNLLNPPKETAGACHEFYYSQIKNVKYEDNAIKIIFHNNDDDALFPCKKGSANIKPALKALHEKLRLTERQRLKKLEEQQNYETLKNQRERCETKDEK